MNSEQRVPTNKASIWPKFTEGLKYSMALRPTVYEVYNIGANSLSVVVKT
jgi:hypothetical protein